MKTLRDLLNLLLEANCITHYGETVNNGISINNQLVEEFDGIHLTDALAGWMVAVVGGYVN